VAGGAKHRAGAASAARRRALPSSIAAAGRDAVARIGAQRRRQGREENFPNLLGVNSDADALSSGQRGDKERDAELHGAKC